jgi:hypothetical protein
MPAPFERATIAAMASATTRTPSSHGALTRAVRDVAAFDPSGLAPAPGCGPPKGAARLGGRLGADSGPGGLDFARQREVALWRKVNRGGRNHERHP